MYTDTTHGIHVLVQHILGKQKKSRSNDTQTNRQFVQLLYVHCGMYD